MKTYQRIILAILLTLPTLGLAADGVIEKQLEEIGSIPNEEVVVVQRKYTRKNWRHEFSPITLGGVPFGTVRRTLFGGAAYTLHVADAFAWEAISFMYTKNFFSSFTDDINNNKLPDRVDSQPNIKPDFQRLLFLLTTGVQWTPFYGKMSTFSRWIAYTEPYLAGGIGIAKTETANYLTFYPAVGIRIFMKEWFSLKVEFRDYIYSEESANRSATGGTTTSLRNNFAVMASFSFWLPKMPK